MRFLTVIFLFFFVPSFAQVKDPKQSTLERFDNILKSVPREKVYVHLDKNKYLPNDTIWFKAYLIDANSNTPSQTSGLIYTELISSNGELIQRLSLPTAFGLTWGSFVLNSDKIKAGKYTFRAYTNWMQNFGSSHLFQKNLEILPLDIVTLDQINKNKSAKKNTISSGSSTTEKQQTIDVQFLPEGGTWLSNRRQKMAFKALDVNGKGIAITGQIVDSQQKNVISFSSNEKGMGVFTMLPRDQERYFAQVSYKGGNQTITIPKTATDGIILKVDNEYLSDSITVTSFSTRTNETFTILGQAKGALCFIASTKFDNIHSKSFKISKKEFPTGVAQVLILDEKGKLLNERSLFINHKQHLNIALQPDRPFYGIRDSVSLLVNVNNPEEKPTISSLSISVTDDNQVAKDSLNDSHILSYFLLQSDLKGEIENPGSYFNQINEQNHNDLDALLLTQGWVSYDWDLARQTSFRPEKEYAISGRVSNILNKPVADANIIMMGSNKNFMMLDTVTNEKGEFTFNQLPLIDSASFVIQAKTKKGKTGTLGIVLNEFTPAPIPLPPVKKTILLETQLDSISENLLKTKAEEYRLTHRDGLLLDVVTIVGKRSIKGSKNLNGAGEADLTLTDADLNPIAKKTLYNVLIEKVKGFREGYPRKSNNRIFFINSNVARLIIDGVELDFFYSSDSGPDSYYHFIKSYLDYYQAEDVKGIEVMDSRRYSMSYKSRFMHPMDDTEYSFIEVTTKTGQGPFLKKAANIYMHRPVNYGDDRYFYHPRYNATNKDSKQPDFRSTIYWNPNLLSDENGKGAFSFFTADKPGTYTIWIEGTDTRGNFGFKTLKMKVQ
ncbi:MAG: hypothetical protein EOO90_00245 [Pedobacter sp.]|nr:MAG: hypothetical protein EOO90_00245 [Pedobacter sp.]